MNPPQPIDNYTDSDDDDIVVIGCSLPPIPPKAQRVLGISTNEGNLTINTGGSEDTEAVTYFCSCNFCRRFLFKMCALPKTS